MLTRVRFAVRDYSADPAADGATEEQRRKLQSDKKALEEKLASWCRQNFAEAFIAWIHLKAIRLFVESVLRYGLPINIRGMAMHVRAAYFGALHRWFHKSVFFFFR